MLYCTEDLLNVFISRIYSSVRSNHHRKALYLPLTLGHYFLGWDSSPKERNSGSLWDLSPIRNSENTKIDAFLTVLRGAGGERKWNIPRFHCCLCCGCPSSLLASTDDSLAQGRICTESPSQSPLYGCPPLSCRYFTTDCSQTAARVMSKTKIRSRHSPPKYCSGS